MEENVHRKEQKIFVTETPSGVFHKMFISANQSLIYQYKNLKN
jgi:hypothetical protein